jgi:hypothetical protein
LPRPRELPVADHWPFFDDQLNWKMPLLKGMECATSSRCSKKSRTMDSCEIDYKNFMLEKMKKRTMETETTDHLTSSPAVTGCHSCHPPIPAPRPLAGQSGPRGSHRL